jgi:hypothetical protein
MTRAQQDLLIDISLIVHRLASPDDQRIISRSLEALEAEGRASEMRKHYRKHPMKVTMERKP